MSGEQNPINLQGVKKVQEDTSKGVKGNFIIPYFYGTFNLYFNSENK